MYELINAQDIGGFSEHIADNFVEHEVTPGLEQTKDGVKKFFLMQISAFPDLHFTIDDLVAEGDKVAWRFNSTGTQKGDFMGIPPTGNVGNVTGQVLFRLENNRIVEGWVNIDALGLMQQLGVIPMPQPH